MPLILFLAISVFAQNIAPPWIDETWRNADYPNTQWYTGFAVDNIKGKPSAKDYQAIEKAAQNKLSESIQVKIQSSTAVQSSSKQVESAKHSSETTSTDYKQAITTQTNLVLAKVDIKSYYDEKKGEIYAFASVKKKDLADFYKSKMTSIFSFADKEFGIAEYLVEQGKKNLALEKVKVIEDSLKNMNFWGSLLQTVESDNSYLEKESAYWQKANSVKMSLQNSTAIYLDVTKNRDYSDLDDKLAAQMQAKGCNCTIAEAKKDADYSVKIGSKLERCQDSKMFCCWVSATAVVDNPKNSKPVTVKIPEAKGCWAKGGQERAKEEAYKDLINSLATNIIKTINQ